MLLLSLIPDSPGCGSYNGIFPPEQTEIEIGKYHFLLLLLRISEEENRLEAMPRDVTADGFQEFFAAIFFPASATF